MDTTVTPAVPVDQSSDDIKAPEALSSNAEDQEQSHRDPMIANSYDDAAHASGSPTAFGTAATAQEIIQQEMVRQTRIEEKSEAKEHALTPEVEPVSAEQGQPVETADEGADGAEVKGMTAAAEARRLLAPGSRSNRRAPAAAQAGP